MDRSLSYRLLRITLFLLPLFIYGPSAVPRLWRLTEAQGGSSSGFWLSSRPSNAEGLQSMPTASAKWADVYAANKAISEIVVVSHKPVVLGVVTAPMPIVLLGVEGVDGAIVKSVKPKSAGAAAGIKVGDILVRVDGRPVNEPDDVKAAIAAKDSGSAVDIRLVRKGLPVWVSVQF
jgi:membrane-associated protease RseP (regulator of RpoE activity)